VNRIQPWPKIAGIIFLAWLILATIAASQIYLRYTGVDWAYPCHAELTLNQPCLYEWWVEVLWYRDDARIGPYLQPTGAAGAFAAALLIFIIARWWLTATGTWVPAIGGFPAATPSATQPHVGTASWATLREMRRWWSQPASWGGIVIGEAVDVLRELAGEFNPEDKSTWPRPKRWLIDACRRGSSHWIFLAGSGAYKSMCAVVSLLFWTGPVLVLDPAGELAAMSKRARERMGHRVYVLDPEIPGIGTNAIGYINPLRRTAVVHVNEALANLCDMPQPNAKLDPFWDGQARDLIKCLLCHIIWDLPLHQRNLKTLAALIALTQPLLRARLKKISQISASKVAKRLATEFGSAHPETFNGFYLNANKHLSWLHDDALADLVAGDTFEMSDILDGNTDVFLAIPADVLENVPALARVLVGGFMNTAYMARGKFTKRCLCLFDEAAALGAMAILERCRRQARKFGMSMLMIYQSTGQLIKIWGDAGKRDWYEACSRAYSGISEVADAKEIEETIGITGGRARSWSRSFGRGGGSGIFQLFSRANRTLNESETGYPLMRRDRVMQLRDDVSIVFQRARKPALVRRVPAFCRPEIMAQLDPNPYAP